MGMPAGIEKRLNRAMELLQRHMTSFLVFKVKNKKDIDKIVEREKSRTEILDKIVERKTLLVFIDCGKYDGKRPGK